ncbi:MAG: hypothetical protein ACKVVT_02595 [Dehalococcoidia bacterium]
MRVDLYLESGPQKKTTYVHVFEPLGCTWMRPTTDEALAAGPGEVRAYLRFLGNHGEMVEQDGPLEIAIAEHQILRGAFLSSMVFPRDLEPCSAADAKRDRARFAWLADDTLALVAGLSRTELDATPAKGRAVATIIGHVLGAAYAYTSHLKLPGVHKVRAAVEAGEIDARDGLHEGAAVILDRLAALTPEELAMAEPRGGTVRGSSRMFRSLLEHGWEHYSELCARLDVER